MSNILIIKHGSLGDIVQISGVLRDIRENYVNSKIYILTTPPYLELLNKCPYVDQVLIDQRSPRWNIFYLIKLRQTLSKFNFSHIYDLQNSSRTSFYKKYILSNGIWSSTETTLKKGEEKKDFDKDSVLNRFKIQLSSSGLKTLHTLEPNFKWAIKNIDSILEEYFNKKFILLFPFCSPELTHKKWPYFNKLIKILRENYKNLEIAIAPGPNELNEAKNYLSTCITKKKVPLNIMELAGLISKASYIIANDTGPAHMSAHLEKEGIVLFGHHTTPKKVSIETKKFKAITKNDLKDISAEELFSHIKDRLDLINKV